jgi:hypothetical protein
MWYQEKCTVEPPLGGDLSAPRNSSLEVRAAGNLGAFGPFKRDSKLITNVSPNTPNRQYSTLYEGGTGRFAQVLTAV